MYKYETHLHTCPVSRCAGKSVAETLDYYKEKGYDGVFLTNHFVCGNINIDAETPVTSVEDYISKIRNGEIEIFTEECGEI